MSSAARNMKPFSVNQATEDEYYLEARARELDEKLLQHPEAVAQRVRIALIRQLKETAPFLLPLV